MPEIYNGDMFKIDSMKAIPLQHVHWIKDSIRRMWQCSLCPVTEYSKISGHKAWIILGIAELCMKLRNA